ncbi:hypothetical protein D3C85_1253040 [compost metagenome]
MRGGASRRVRFALAMRDFLVVPHRGGEGGDGRRASTIRFSLPTCTRAAHRARELKLRLAAGALDFKTHCRGTRQSRARIQCEGKNPMREQETNARVRIQCMGKSPNAKQPCAKRHLPAARHRVSPQRPPARPAGGGPCKTFLTSRNVGQNLKNPDGRSARQAEPAEPGAAWAWGGRGV